MKKKVIIIASIVVTVVLAVALCFVFFGNKERTLEEITSAKDGGGYLRVDVDYYTVVEIYFESEKKNGDEREGTCYVITSHYKKAAYSPTGKIFDYSEEEEYSCKFTDYSLTMGLLDHYTYSVETRDGKEYVVFSKPFLEPKVGE